LHTFLDIESADAKSLSTAGGRKARCGWRRASLLHRLPPHPRFRRSSDDRCAACPSKRPSGPGSPRSRATTSQGRYVTFVHLASQDQCRDRRRPHVERINRRCDRRPNQVDDLPPRAPAHGGRTRRPGRHEGAQGRGSCGFQRSLARSVKCCGLRNLLAYARK
jgi:hypothetical protein